MSGSRLLTLTGPRNNDRVYPATRRTETGVMSGKVLCMVGENFYCFDL